MIDEAGQTRKKSELDTIDQATLTPLVRRAHSATIEIIDWS